MLSERHTYLYSIPVFPYMVAYCSIRAWLIALGNRLTIELYVEALCCPIRHTKLESKVGSSLTVGSYCEHTMLCRPLTLLLYSHSLSLPTSSCRHIESHPHSVIINEISSLLVFHMILRACTSTACALWSIVAIRFYGIHAHSILICNSPMFGMQRAYYLIIEHTLIVIHILCIIRIEAV